MPISIYVVISVISGLTATSKSVFSHKKKTFYVSKKPQFPLSSIKLGFKSLEKNIFHIALFEQSVYHLCKQFCWQFNQINTNYFEKNQRYFLNGKIYSRKCILAVGSCSSKARIRKNPQPFISLLFMARNLLSAPL